MPATDPQTLLNSAACYNNYGPGEWPLIELALLRQRALELNAMAATDVPSLMAAANTACYNNYSAQSWLLKLALLQIIAKSVNPAAATDAASLLSGSGTACYNNYGPGTWPLLELRLLNIIAGGTP